MTPQHQLDGGQTLAASDHARDAAGRAAARSRRFGAMADLFLGGLIDPAHARAHRRPTRPATQRPTTR